jgi:sugar transferase EpsL
MNLIMNYKVIKRIFDVIVAALVLIVTSPLTLLIAAVISIKVGSPLFCQHRPGLNGEIFLLIKFKTMSSQKTTDGLLLPDEDRLTSFGNLLRRLSLDELPQLINVIRGDMSLVGPRPLLIEYLPQYSTEHARRHDVKPGITGWAQINGRNAISWDEKFELDIWYVDNQSFVLDLKILLITAWKVLRRDGISSKTSITMEKYEGS